MAVPHCNIQGFQESFRPKGIPGGRNLKKLYYLHVVICTFKAPGPGKKETSASQR